MTAEVEFWRKRYLQLLTELKTGLDVESVAQKAKTLRRNYELEISLLHNPLLKKKCREEKERLDALFDSAKLVHPHINARKFSGVDRLSDADSIQNATERAYVRTLGVIEQAVAIGEETFSDLNSQTVQIRRVDRVVGSVDSDVVRAQKLVATFARRIATDKIFQLFAFVNAVLFVLIVLFLALR